MFVLSLRSADPCGERSRNTGFVWSPSVSQEELQQGLGVSVKVTVISDHFREPLTFTCDGRPRTLRMVSVHTEIETRHAVTVTLTPA